MIHSVSFFALVALFILSASAPTHSGQRVSEPAPFKQDLEPYDVPCLTGVLTAEEAQLRHELHMLQLEQSGSEIEQANIVDVGNIVVMEDDGTTIFPENPFGLDHVSILLAPNSVGGYDVLPERFSFEIPGGEKIPLTDDSAQRVDFSQGFTFSYFGRAQTSLFVNSNGNLTFGAENVLPAESLGGFLGRLQISPFWDDLDPSAGDGIYVRQTADRLVITWNRVPEFSVANSNTFQVVLASDGRIRFTYVEMSALDGLVGLSPGPPAAFNAVRFKSLPIRGLRRGLVELFNPVPNLNTVRTAQRFYENHPDTFDVLTSWTNFNQGGAFAFFQFVKNEIRGIGRSVFDNSARFGSKGRLQGFVFMNDLNVWPADPRARVSAGLSANSTLSILAQELGHRWLVDLRFNDSGVMSNELVGRQLAHWSFFTHTESTQSTLANPISSSVEGNAWRDNGDGTFTTLNLIDGFSPMDQYLMGLRKPEEVPDFFVISDPAEGSVFHPLGFFSTTTTRGLAPFPNVTVRGRKKPVSIRQIIEAEGPRTPDTTNSPKQFRTAFVLVVRRGQAPRSEELEKLDRIRREWESYFFEHTDGRASFDTNLRPERVITTIDPPRGVPGTRLDAVISGVGLSGATEVMMGGTGVAATIRPGGTDTSLPVTITVGENAPQGVRRFQVRTPRGILDSEGLAFQVTNFTVLATGFNNPRGVAVSTSGDVFLSNSGAGTVVRVTPDGNPSVFARRLTGPTGLAFNRAGELFVADSVGRVSRLSADGQIRPFAAGLAAPTSLAFDSRDQLFVLNTGANSVVRVAPDGSTSVFARVPPPSVSFGGLAIDRDDNVYVSNFGGGTIFRFSPEGQMSTFAILGPFVEGMAFDGRGNLYVGNGSAGSLLRVSPSGLTALVSEATVSGPTSLATDAEGRLYAVSLARPELLQFSPSVGLSPPGTPRIANVVPSLGPPGTTLDATINGTGLGGATSVSMTGRGVSASIRAGGTPTSLPVTITIAPDVELGARQVVVTTPQGPVASGNAPNFTFGSGAIAFAVQHPPAITSVTPANPAPGQNVVIAGTGFEDTFSEFVFVIFVQGAKGFGATVRERTGNRIVATVPTLLTSGPATLTISRFPSPVAPSRPLRIDIGAVPAPPEITAMTPSRPSGNQRVFLSMAGLPTAAAASFTIRQGGKVLELDAGAVKPVTSPPDMDRTWEQSEFAERGLQPRGGMKSLLAAMLRDPEVEPWTRAYLSKLLASADGDQDLEASIAPALNLQTGVLVDLPSNLGPGPATVSATVTLGGKTSTESKPFEFTVPVFPTAVELQRVTEQVRTPGQLVALAANQGAGFNPIPQENVAAFSQGSNTFSSRAIGFQGPVLVFPVPDGLVPGMAEVRVTSAVGPLLIFPRTTPPSNPVTLLINPVPAAPSLVSVSPLAAPPGAVLTIAGTVGSFSPRPQDNTVIFTRPGGASPPRVETALTADEFGTVITVKVPTALKPGAVDVSVSPVFKGAASPASVPRRVTVAGAFVLNVPLMARGFVTPAREVLDTAITLANTSNETATVVFTRFSSSGSVLNPVAAPLQKTLRPGEHLAMSASDLFFLNTSSSPFTGWLRIHSNVELKGNFFVFDRNLNRLIDGAPLVGESSTELVFPHVEKNRSSQTNTFYAIVNPNDEPAAIELTEWDPQGRTVSTTSLQLPANGSSLIALSGEDRRGGFLRAKSNVPISGALFFGNTDHLSLLSARPASGSTEFVLAHFAVGDGFDTEISLTNAAGQANEIFVAVFDKDRRQVGSLRNTLPANTQFLGSVSRLLGLSATQGVISGYIVGNSSGPGILAFAELSFAPEGSVTASSSQEFTAPGMRFVFPELAHNVPSGGGQTFLTGLALLNPYRLQQAKVKVAVFDGTGKEIASTDLTLQPGQQLARVLAAEEAGAGFFRGALTLGSGYMLVTSDLPVAASLLVFTDHLTQIFTVQGQNF